MASIFMRWRTRTCFWNTGQFASVKEPWTYLWKIKVHVKSKLTIYFVNAHCNFCGEQFIHASQSTKKVFAFIIFDPNLKMFLPYKLLQLFVTYTILKSITSSEICALHLNPSKCTHTPGAVGSQCCGTWGAVEGSVPCSRVSPQSWTLPAGAEIQTHNLGLQVWRAIH